MPLNPPATGRWIAEVCENGHDVSPWIDHDPSNHRAFCERCGAPTIQACPNCQTAIPGWSMEGMSTRYDPPDFCGSCGQPYPWKARKRQAAQDAVALLEGLSDEDRAALAKAIDQLGEETAATEVAAMRAKVLLNKARGEAVPIARKAITETATEVARRILLGGA